jgi:catechol 2,3-dioxygenase-like lactoylglutathione lyase family enzyme
VQPPDYSVEHLGLPARDPAGLKDWYERVLGATVVHAQAGPPPAFLLALQGGLWLEIYASERALDDTANNRLAGWRHLAISTDSLEAAVEDLAARGVRFSEPVRPAGGGGRVRFFADPEGNLLHLVERPADSALRMQRQTSR